MFNNSLTGFLAGALIFLAPLGTSCGTAGDPPQTSSGSTASSLESSTSTGAEAKATTTDPSTANDSTGLVRSKEAGRQRTYPTQDGSCHQEWVDSKRVYTICSRDGLEPDDWIRVTNAEYLCMWNAAHATAHLPPDRAWNLWDREDNSMLAFLCRGAEHPSIPTESVEAQIAIRIINFLQARKLLPDGISAEKAANDILAINALGGGSFFRSIRAAGSSSSN